MRKPTPTNAQGQNPLEEGLYITATPIGNAQDVSLRALHVLDRCDAILAEDTRTTAKLLAIHGISRPLVSYNDHNAPRVRPKMLTRLENGARLALVSDAGTPLVSDPGYKLVREAIAAGARVHAVPGASAALAGLVLSGLPTNRFLFVGFLPPTRAARRTALAEIGSLRATLIFFEAPQRLKEALEDMASLLGEREAAVARELTKLHEDVRRGSLLDLATLYKAITPRGEVTVVVGPPRSGEPDFTSADALLDKALPMMPLRAAVDLISDGLKLPRKAIYTRALLRKALIGNDD